MGPILLAYVGIALMTGLIFIGSSYGVTIAGNAMVGTMKKNPDVLGTYTALSTLPSSQGLYGFVGYFTIQKFLVADISMLAATVIFGAGLVLGFAGFYSLIRRAQVCVNGITGVGVGRNVFGAMIITTVFPELYVILALLAVTPIGGTISVAQSFKHLDIIEAVPDIPGAISLIGSVNKLSLLVYQLHKLVR